MSHSMWSEWKSWSWSSFLRQNHPGRDFLRTMTICSGPKYVFRRGTQLGHENRQFSIRHFRAGIRKVKTRFKNRRECRPFDTLAFSIDTLAYDLAIFLRHV